MKRPNRKVPHRVLSEKQKAWFIWNLDYPGEIDRPNGCFKTWEEAEEAWKQCGEEITRKDMEASPGSRPWAWWAWTNRQISPGTCNADKRQYLIENDLLEPLEKAKIDEVYNEKNTETGENEDVFKRLVENWGS
ncbi:MAG: hypothetical protein ABIL06_09235 [Pseudomonadota bacterium]